MDVPNCIPHTNVLGVGDTMVLVVVMLPPPLHNSHDNMKNPYQIMLLKGTKVYASGRRSSKRQKYMLLDGGLVKVKSICFWTEV